MVHEIEAVEAAIEAAAEEEVTEEVSEEISDLDKCIKQLAPNVVKNVKSRSNLLKVNLSIAGNVIEKGEVSRHI